MEDEYIEEETEGGSQRPFLLAVGALVTIFILAAICSAAVLMARGAGDQSAQIAARETENAIVAVTNAAVTQTIAAMQTEAAQPTNTPEPPTATATVPQTPTDTPAPTETPVVAKATEKVPPTETGTPEGGAIIGGDTPTPGAIAETDGTTDSTGGGVTTGGTGTGGADSGSLPQTGIETWGVVVTAVILVFVVVAARRLRSQ